jgi:hypothetical protein
VRDHPFGVVEGRRQVRCGEDGETDAHQQDLDVLTTDVGDGGRRGSMT